MQAQLAQNLPITKLMVFLQISVMIPNIFNNQAPENGVWQDILHRYKS